MDKNDLFIMKPKFKQLDSEGKMHVEFGGSGASRRYT